VIRYSLVCDQNHSFESWFRNSRTSDAQLKRGLVACPVCGSVKVSKAIMAPAIKARKEKAELPASQPVALLSEKERETRHRLKMLHEQIRQNAEHVGGEFPKLARQMHYEEIPARFIYGEAKPHEVKELLEEGVDVAPIPPLPDQGH
jgi:hypothetical protein